jgi:dTDP-4-dehydrorhamnose reductase
LKLLIIGGNGMAGSVMVEYFRQQPGYEVIFTTRDKNSPGSLFLDATDFKAVEFLVNEEKPQIIINCTGLLNQKAEEHYQDAIKVNGVLPHHLAKLADYSGAKLIHISTDCVFSGDKGSYTEDDHTDGQSVYALTKALGEVRDARHLTIRTSIIGPEKRPEGIGLFKWFMEQTGMVKGYQNVFWNGVTTLELAKFTEACIREGVTGLYHLTSSETVSKYELLKMIQAEFIKEDVSIIPDTAIKLDRTLRNTRTDIQYIVPGYPEMLSEMHAWMNKNG